MITLLVALMFQAAPQANVRFSRSAVYQVLDPSDQPVMEIKTESETVGSSMDQKWDFTLATGERFHLTHSVSLKPYKTDNRLVFPDGTSLSLIGESKPLAPDATAVEPKTHTVTGRLVYGENTMEFDLEGLPAPQFKTEAGRRLRQMVPQGPDVTALTEVFRAVPDSLCHVADLCGSTTLLFTTFGDFKKKDTDEKGWRLQTVTRSISKKILAAE
ncbi:MAG: hypothetical protein ABI914_00570 [Acidobacteriota bacterium]